MRLRTGGLCLTNMSYIVENIEWKDKQAYINYRKEEFEALLDYLKEIQKEYDEAHDLAEYLYQKRSHIERLVRMKQKELEECKL